MRFIRKKNLGEGEEILYTPRLHWFYVVKYMIQSLPFFLVLVVLWFLGDVLTLFSAEMGYEMWMPLRFLIRQVFLAGVLVVLVIFVCRILQYLNTEYGVTNKRLIIKKGVLRLFVAEIPTDRIESIYCVQGILGRIFHYGTVYISGVGGMMPFFYMVARPYGLRRKIINIVEKNKTVTIVHGDPSRVRIPPRPEPIVEPEPLYRYGTFVRVLPDSDN